MYTNNKQCYPEQNHDKTKLMHTDYSVTWKSKYAQTTMFPGALLLNVSVMLSYVSSCHIVMICHHVMYEVMSSCYGLCYGLCYINMLGLMLWLMLGQHFSSYVMAYIMSKC